MAEKYDIEKYNRRLKKFFDDDEDRYYHTQGVRYTAVALAMAHGEDYQKAELAGLLHDSAKNIPDPKKIKLCEKNDIPITPVERENVYLLHAKLGAYIARKKYKVEDGDILNAITFEGVAANDAVLRITSSRGDSRRLTFRRSEKLLFMILMSAVTSF